ncbi:MAG: hypothetical protein LBV72_12235 [Tannerella sp.]|jgi:hypothetical protein|nr:hypothetical protein [Tannerella sp.]
MKQLYFIILFLFFSSVIVGQEIILQEPDNLNPETTKSNILTADIDQDDTIDSLYYDYQKQAIVCSLSSHSFEKTELDFPNEYYGTKVSISAYKGGINIDMLHMRAFNYESYGYDPETGRFRLESLSHENLGNALNDGSGTYSMDFITGDFTADWNYFDIEADSLVSLPTIELNMHIPPVYWDDSIAYIPGYDLFDSYKEAYTPGYTDTLQFIAFNNDYDISILIGKTENEEYTMPVQYDPGNIYKGDLITASVETVIYHEPGDNSYYATNMITHIDKIKPGKLSLFMENNKKPIRFSGIHTEYWRYEYRAPNDVMYFLANTTQPEIIRALNTTGELEVEFSTAPKEYSEQNDCLMATIRNHHKNKTKTICKLIIIFNGDYSSYYLFDEKSQQYIPLKVENQ